MKPTRLAGLRAPTNRFFVLTGVDAAGKSTVLARVAELRPDWCIGNYEPQSWLPHPDLPHLEWSLNIHPRDVVHTLEPLARATFLLQMILCHWEYWIAPRLLDGRVVVMDSYYYRFYAKEQLRKVVPAFFYEVLDHLPRAEAIVLADIEAEVAARRRDRFNLYEVDNEVSVEGFLRFQHAQRALLEELCRERCRGVERIDANSPPEQGAAAIIEIIERRLAASGES